MIINLLFKKIRIKNLLATCTLAGCFANVLDAQDTLPRFNVTTQGNNKIIVSWTNLYPAVTQISIQRSIDSTRNFKTILTIPDPSSPKNGFVDTKATTPFNFYRLFIVLDSGKYLFTDSKRPYWDTSRAQLVKKEFNGDKKKVSDSERVPEIPLADTKVQEKKKEELPPKKDIIVAEKIYTVIRKDSLWGKIPEKQFRRFRDSLITKTKDTLVFRNLDSILIRPFVPKEVYRPSIYVYTSKDGNISIALPEATRKKYLVKFFEEDNRLLFEIKDLENPVLILDKVNFLHAGWFRFELYENGQLKEKNKFFIPRDF